ncbi:phospholipase/Carboxylesterase [Zopfochytrium polystomum]|nr:phospholipase/Carboxylesterase [Zopfochytrium polystomum]
MATAEAFGHSRPPPIVVTGRSHSATVIFLHGLGDSGSGWVPFAKSLSRSLPHIKFILPTASSIPVTINRGSVMPAWFDIRAFGDYDIKSIKGSVEYIKGLIAAEHATAGIPPDRVVLGGFSQGCFLSMTTATAAAEKLQLDGRLAGFVGLSGTVLAAHTEQAMATKQPHPNPNATTPVFYGLGGSDPMITPDRAESVVARLRQGTPPRDLTVRVYPGMGHASCAEEVADVEAFLKRVIPDQVK